MCSSATTNWISSRSYKALILDGHVLKTTFKYHPHKHNNENHIFIAQNMFQEINFKLFSIAIKILISKQAVNRRSLSLTLVYDFAMFLGIISY